MDWITFEQEMESLSDQVKLLPDLIVGITRGGVVPARILCSLLGIQKMHCISVSKQGSKRMVTTEIQGDISGKTILLVEDMLETGKSMMVAKAYLESKGAKVQTACLYTMPRSQIEPDYFLREQDKVVAFPWEKWERQKKQAEAINRGIDRMSKKERAEMAKMADSGLGYRVGAEIL